MVCLLFLNPFPIPSRIPSPKPSGRSAANGPAPCVKQRWRAQTSDSNGRGRWRPWLGALGGKTPRAIRGPPNRADLEAAEHDQLAACVAGGAEAWIQANFCRRPFAGLRQVAALGDPLRAAPKLPHRTPMRAWSSSGVTACRWGWWGVIFEGAPRCGIPDRRLAIRFRGNGAHPQRKARGQAAVARRLWRRSTGGGAGTAVAPGCLGVALNITRKEARPAGSMACGSDHSARSERPGAVQSRNQPRIPVLGACDGICHQYVGTGRVNLDSGAAALRSTGKDPVPGSLDATETLLVHQEVACRLPGAGIPAFTAAGVEPARRSSRLWALACGQGRQRSDWLTEYSRLVLAVRVVARPEGGDWRTSPATAPAHRADLYHQTPTPPSASCATVGPVPGVFHNCSKPLRRWLPLRLRR